MSSPKKRRGPLNAARGGLAVILLISLLSTGNSGTALAQPQNCPPANLPNTIPQTVGFPPHKNWQLPTGPKNDWLPAAADDRHVLMINPPASAGTVGPTSNPLKLALVANGAHTLRPLAATAYPPSHTIGGEEAPGIFPVINGSWIADATAPSTGGGQWLLWSSNLQSHHYVTLVRGSSQDIPGFALDAGRLVWDSTFRNRTTERVTSSRIIVYDLSRKQMRKLPLAPKGMAYKDPVISGDRVAWVAYTFGPFFAGIMVYNLRTNTLTTVLRKGQTSIAQPQIGMSGRFLIYSPTLQLGSLPGDVVLLDLQTGKRRTLDHHGLAAALGNNLAIWEVEYKASSTSAIADLQTPKVWTLQTEAQTQSGAPRVSWNPAGLSGAHAAIGGRNVVIERDLSGRGILHPAYFLWRFGPTCSAS